MNQKKILFRLLVVLIFFVIVYFTFGQNIAQKLFPEKKNSTVVLPPAQSYPATLEAEDQTKENSQKELPSQFLLSVPFTPQAPTANWDELHNEACEEASALMTNAFFQSDTRSTLPAPEAEKEIEKLTKWQQDHFGYYLSTDVQETARMIESVYGLKTEVVKTFSEDTIKTALTQNKLILVPVNGRLLGNPYFQTPGPIYHMFVIRGYDEKSFIVNEPGTKRGENYRYTYETIKNAIGDYDHEKKETDPSKSAIILVSK